MQTQHKYYDMETTGVNLRSRRTSSFQQIVQSREHRRRIRISLPRRQVCFTKRVMLAALREAEYSEWMASGGDFLSSMHQPVY